LLQRKSNNITYSDCVFVALGIHHAMRMRHIFICGLPNYVFFPHYFIKARFRKKRLLKKKVCFDFSLQILSETVLILRRSHRHVIINVPSLLVQYPIFLYSTRYSCQILTKLGFSQQTFEKHSNIKFHENPSNSSQVLPRGRTNRQTW
jgi:hypothetical protein